MKTERMVLLVTPADKAALSARAASFGLSVSELIRQAAFEYDPTETAARAEVEALLPEFSATIGKIHETFERMIVRLDEGERRRAEMDTPKYKTAVREAVRNDPTINWDRVRALMGHGKAAA